MHFTRALHDYNRKLHIYLQFKALYRTRRSKVRLAFPRYSILTISTYPCQMNAYRNAPSRIARSSQMQSKSSDVAVGSFECHGFSCIVALRLSRLHLQANLKFEENYSLSLCITANMLHALKLLHTFIEIDIYYYTENSPIFPKQTIHKTIHKNI